MKYIYFLTVFLCANISVNALFVINEPSVIVYETPEPNGHIEDIIRYGTPIEIVEEKGNWASITYAGWHGWVMKEKLLKIDADPNIDAGAFVGFRGAYLFHVADTEWGPFLQLPFETPLKVLQELPESHRRWLIVQLQDGRTGYVQRSQIIFSKPKLSMKEAIDFSQLFLGTKYLWGGTTSFGYDCSGFVQMLYRQMGITLPRNSNQQAVDPKFEEIQLSDVIAGDLVFFKNGSGKVVHVGMMINDKEFIHAFTKENSWVSINEINDERFHNGYFFYSPLARRLKI